MEILLWCGGDRQLRLWCFCVRMHKQKSALKVGGDLLWQTSGYVEACLHIYRECRQRERTCECFLPEVTLCKQKSALKVGGDLLFLRRSTIGATGLNCCVRNENRCTPSANPPTLNADSRLIFVFCLKDSELVGMGVDPIPWLYDPEGQASPFHCL